MVHGDRPAPVVVHVGAELPPRIAAPACFPNLACCPFHEGAACCIFGAFVGIFGAFVGIVGAFVGIFGTFCGTSGTFASMALCSLFAIFVKQRHWFEVQRHNATVPCRQVSPQCYCTV